MKCVLIFLVSVQACGSVVQSAPVADDSPELGLAPYLLGGSRVKQLNREYAVLLRLQKDYQKYDYCNGVRLNKHWLLTAADCLERPKYTHVRFAFPENGTFVHKYYHFNALKHVIHPNYNAKSKRDNIALVASDFSKWKDNSQYLKLPLKKDSMELFTGAAAEVTGVQQTTDPVTKEELEAVNIFAVAIAKYTLCDAIYSKTTYINEQTCVTSVFTGQPRGLNQEDLGVPLVLKDRTLFGIALHVRPWSGGIDEPIVFHRVYPYLKWIHKTTLIPIS